MEPIDFGGALLRSWRLLAVLAILGAVVGVFLPTSAPAHTVALYKTTAIVGAAPAAGPGANGITPLGGAGVSTSQIMFYAEKTEIAVAAARDIHVDNETIPELEQFITVVGPSKKGSVPAGEVEITGEQLSAFASALFTNAFTNELGKYLLNLVTTQRNQELQTLANQVKILDRGISQAGSDTTKRNGLTNQLNIDLTKEQSISSTVPYTGYEILRPADPSQASKSGSHGAGLGASHKVRGLVGLGLGLLLGALIVLLIELLDKRIRNASRAESTFGFPVVAEIPAAGGRGGGSATLVDPFGEVAVPLAEAYRMLQMSVMLEALPPADEGDLLDRRSTNGHGEEGNGRPRLTAGDRSPYLPARIVDTPVSAAGRRQVILVVSPGPETTRPFVVANLAATYAAAGERVMVISTEDLHARSGPNLLRPVSGAIRPADVQQHLRDSPIENVTLLSIRRLIRSSAQLVTRMPAVLAAARQLTDVIIVEAPPLLAVHDAEALAPSADVVLVVGECMVTTFDQARKAGELLRRIGAPVLGVVLTNVRIGARDVRRRVPQPELEAESEPIAADADPAAAKVHT